MGRMPAVQGIDGLLVVSEICDITAEAVADVILATYPSLLRSEVVRFASAELFDASASVGTWARVCESEARGLS